MNPATLQKIQAFSAQVLRPAFTNIKGFVEDSEHTVILASNAETGIETVDAMLQRMHLDSPYLSQPLTHPSVLQDTSAPTQAWIGESLWVGFSIASSGTVPNLLEQYCLSVEFGIIPTASGTEHLQLTAVIGCTQPGTAALQRRSQFFEADGQPLGIEEIDDTHITSHFLKSYQDFETQTLDQANNLESIPPELETGFSPREPVLARPTLDPEAPFAPSTLPSEPAQDPEFAQPVNPLTPQQQLFNLQQKARDLSKQLSPSPHTSLPCNLNTDLDQTARIIPIQDKYNRTIDLCLEYSPAIADRDLTEYLQRLGHYHSLQRLARVRLPIEEQLQTWIKQAGQPSLGAIAPHLQQHITDHSQQLYQRLTDLTNSRLNRLASELQTDLDHFSTEQQQQKAFLDTLEQNPVLGYLDHRLLSSDDRLQSINPFTAPNQPLDLEAKHLDRKDKSLQLTHIAACQSEKYRTYRERYPSLPEVQLAMQYTITQKLYPGRPFSVGLAAKVVHPRLELLWGSPHESARPDDPLAQIWCIQPMLKFHPPQWIVIAITSETRKLNAIALEDGRMAQEGTREYLARSLQIMTQHPDEYTNDLGKLVLEALEQGRVKYTHLHQTQDLETEEPRDIVQLQFLLREIDPSRR
jgi:hypothetical protein